MIKLNWNRLIYALVCSWPTSVPALADDWPQFLGPGRDGRALNANIDLENWNPLPNVEWTLQLGTSYGAPVVSKDQLFQFDRFGDSERLTCFDVNSKQEIWRSQSTILYSDKYGYNNGPRCSPIIDGSNVYTYGVAGDLRCVEINSGELLWHVDVNKKYNVIANFFGVASNPIIYQDLILVMVGGSPAVQSQSTPVGAAKPNHSAIVAFDKMTGEEVYRCGNDLASYSSIQLKKLGNKTFGFALLRGGLYCWNPDRSLAASTDGSPVSRDIFYFPWRASMLESVNAAVPVFDGNRVLISEAYEIGSVVLDLTPILSGKEPTVVWKDSGPRSKCRFRAHWATPIIIDGYIYGGHGRNEPDSDLRCVRLSDGEVMWRDRRHERMSVTQVGDKLVALGEYGRLEVIEPTPTKLKVLKMVDLEQESLLRYPCWAAPIIAGDAVFLRGKDRLIKFRMGE